MLVCCFLYLQKQSVRLPLLEKFGRLSIGDLQIRHLLRGMLNAFEEYARATMPGDQGFFGMINGADHSIDEDLVNPVPKVFGGKQFFIDDRKLLTDRPLQTLQTLRFGLPNDAQHEQECRGSNAACGYSALNCRERSIDNKAARARHFARR